MKRYCFHKGQRKPLIQVFSQQQMWDHPLRVLLSCNGACQFKAGGRRGTLTGDEQVKVVNKYR